jgi:uncharacterized membrane protein
MYVEALSLFTAFCYGLSTVLVRMGVKNSNPMTATLIAALMQVLVMSGMLLILPPSQLVWTGIAFFAASGILASALGRLCNYMSIEKLGVPTSASIVGSNPVFSMLFAVFLLGEKITVSILIGTVLVVAGVVLMTFTNGGERFSLRKTALFLPILAAVFYGASAPVRKMGLTLLPEPILGALIGAAVTLVLFSVTCISSGNNKTKIRLHRGCVGYFAVSGVAISLGWASMFTALLAGKVSVVSTIVGINPLFSLLLTLMLLRSSEKISRTVVAGCLVIVAGVTVVTLCPL